MGIEPVEGVRGYPEPIGPEVADPRAGSQIMSRRPGRAKGVMSHVRPSPGQSPQGDRFLDPSPAGDVSAVVPAVDPGARYSDPRDHDRQQLGRSGPRFPEEV